MRLVPTDGEGKNTQGNRVERSEVFWRPKAASDEIAIFLYIGRQLVGRKFIRAEPRLPSKDDDIATGAIAVKIEGHTRVLLQMLQAPGT